jgi:hypothetical protein
MKRQNETVCRQALNLSGAFGKRLSQLWKGPCAIATVERGVVLAILTFILLEILSKFNGIKDCN